MFPFSLLNDLDAYSYSWLYRQLVYLLVYVLFDQLILSCLRRYPKLSRYVIAVLMSTMVEKQRLIFEYDSDVEPSGYFTLVSGEGDKTANIPYGAVRSRLVLPETFRNVAKHGV